MPTRRVEKATPEFTDCWRTFASEFDYLYRTVRRHGVPPQDVEDTVQDVFLTMWTRWAQYDPTRPLRPWLAGIAVRLSYHRIQRRRYGRSLPLDPAAVSDPSPDPEESLSTHRDRALVLSALAALPEKYRAPLVLHEFDGLSVSEIAQLDGIALPTASARLQAARRAFGKTLKRLLQFGSLRHLGLWPDLDALLSVERPSPAAPAAVRQRAIARARSIATGSGAPPSTGSAWRVTMAASTAALLAAVVASFAGRASVVAARVSGSPVTGIALPRAKRPPGPAVSASVEPWGGMPPRNGLVGYFTFDDGPGSAVARDRSGNNHHCLLRQLDARTSWIAGVRAGAIRLRGRGWLECPSGLNLPASADEITVAAWIRTQSMWGAQTIVGRQTGTRRRDDLFFGLNNGQLTVQSRTFRKRLDRWLPHRTGEWVHVAFRRRADGTLTLYAGGAPIGENRGRVMNIGGVTNALTIGGSINGPDQKRADELFAGELDDLVIYNRALATDELERLAAREPPP